MLLCKNNTFQGADTLTPFNHANPWLIIFLRQHDTECSVLTRWLSHYRVIRRRAVFQRAVTVRRAVRRPFSSHGLVTRDQQSCVNTTKMKSCAMPVWNSLASLNNPCLDYYSQTQKFGSDVLLDSRPVNLWSQQPNRQVLDSATGSYGKCINVLFIWLTCRPISNTHSKLFFFNLKTRLCLLIL